MPKITMEFSVPEDPESNTVTVTIEGPGEQRVSRQAMATVDYYTTNMIPAVLRIPDYCTDPCEGVSVLHPPHPACTACRMSGGSACHNHRGEEGQ